LPKENMSSNLEHPNSQEQTMTDTRSPSLTTLCPKCSFLHLMALIQELG
jgi:hypothetical protein